MAVVLGRKPGEKVRIRVRGVDVWVWPMSYGGTTRLAFEGPREAEFAREELLTPDERRDAPATGVCRRPDLGGEGG